MLSLDLVTICVPGTDMELDPVGSQFVGGLEDVVLCAFDILQEAVDAVGVLLFDFFLFMPGSIDIRCV